MTRLIFYHVLALPLLGWMLVNTGSVAQAQSAYFDTFAGDMYYAVRVYGMFYEDEPHSGDLKGFAPADTNIASLGTGFSVTSEDAAGLMGGLGIALGYSTRAEFEGSWTQYEASACATGIRDDAPDGKALDDAAVAKRVCQSTDNDIFGLMVNVYHDFDYVPVLPKSLAPFIGVGIGYAFVNNKLSFALAQDADEPEWTNNDTLPGAIEYKAAADANDDDTIMFSHANDDGIRWGIYGGVTMWGLELMYRYWGGEKNTRGHLLSLGYRF